MNSMKPNGEGFTGLEAAIVLIAFVVVAAVFSYVVLGAGFFTTQKSQEVVHTGVQQASSTLQIVGNVYGTSSDNANVQAVNFTIALAPGGTPVDITKMTLTWSTSGAVQTLTYLTGNNALATAGGWTVYAIRNDIGTNNQLLEKGEQFDIMAMPSTAIGVNTDFQLEVKPIIGAALAIKRTTPAAINGVNILY
jgi:flagellin FlaB